MDVLPTVVHESAAPLDGWDDPLRGHIDFRVLLSAGLTPTRALTTGMAYLPPGGWLGRHRHAPPEVYYVIEGEGTMVLDGVEHPVTAGSSVFVPGDVEHGIHNTGGSLLRFHYVFPVDAFHAVEYHFG
jgi:mannose-6-phosphate isomerase-like protein (cupin superfamily)